MQSATKDKNEKAAKDAEKSAKPAAAQEDTKKDEKEKKSSKVHFESVLPREEAVSYFEAIAAGMKKGKIQLKQGDESISLELPPQVGLEVKAVRKGEKEKITFELVWRKTPTTELKIGSS